MTATARLESVLSKSSADGERHFGCSLYQDLPAIDTDSQGSEADELVAQLSLSLSLIQGVVLNHEASKHYLGRRSALEVRHFILPNLPSSHNHYLRFY